MKSVILAVSIAAVSLTANAAASSQPTAGRNDQVSVSQKMVAAIKKSAAKGGKCVPAQINPGQSKAAWHIQIQKAFKGVKPKSTVTSVKIVSRFMSSKGELKRICVTANGRGH